MAETPVWKVELVVPERALAVFEQALEPVAAATATFATAPEGMWRLEAYIPGRPHHDGITAAVALAARQADIPEPSYVCIPLPDRDWVLESQAQWQPSRAGRFYIHPTHQVGGGPPGCWPIAIDAGTAFGSGDHATTHTCLQALADLAVWFRPRRALDVGCGSGILAIAAAKAWRCKVVGGDIDPEAVRVTRENAIRNAVGVFVDAYCADGVRSRALDRERPYDLIVANILARPLTAIARNLVRLCGPGAVVILSGLLEVQERQVLHAYRIPGLYLVKRYRRDGWSTLVLRRRPSRSAARRPALEDGGG